MVWKVFFFFQSYKGWEEVVLGADESCDECERIRLILKGKIVAWNELCLLITNILSLNAMMCDAFNI